MNQRIDQLDSLRGLAAFGVLLHHIILIFPIYFDTPASVAQPWWLDLIKYSPLSIIVAGHEAVIFFFVLSGFVLSLPFLKTEQAVPYWLFLTKRILRIYPPYIIAVASAFILREWCYSGNISYLSTWFNKPWHYNVSPEVIWNHLLLIGSFDNCSFDITLWSLVHEMRISIIFPLLVYLVKFREKTAWGMALCFSAFFHFMMRQRSLGFIAFAHDYFASLHYIGMFVIGVSLAKHRHDIVCRIGCLKRRTKISILIIAVLAYTNSGWLPHYAAFGIHPLETLFTKPVSQDWLTMTGVALIISLSLGTLSATNFLSFGIVRYLGRISYSLYLFHGILLIAGFHLLHLYIPTLSILVIVFVATLLVSTMSYYWLEAPSIRVGKYLTQRWKDAKKQSQKLSQNWEEVRKREKWASDKARARSGSVDP